MTRLLDRLNQLRRWWNGTLPPRRPRRTSRRLRVESLEHRELFAVGFDAPVAVDAAGLPPKDISVADIDRDGRLDAVVGSQAGQFRVFWGDGLGGFSSSSLFNKSNTSALVGSPQIADITGDGNLDIVLFDPSGFSVFPGRGNRSLGTNVRYALTNVETGLVADVTGDGSPDVIVGHSSGGSQVLGTYVNNRTGTLTRARQITLSGPTLPGASLAVGEVTGDRKTDLILAGNDNRLSLFPGNGDGTFRAAVNIARQSTTGYTDAKLADVSGDGKLDLLVLDRTNGFVNVGTGNNRGQFTFTKYAMGTTPESLLVADLDADGRADLVTANSGSGDVTVRLNRGNATFDSVQSFSAGVSSDTNRPSDLAIGDLNRDGRLDLLVGHSRNDAVATSTQFTTLRGLATPAPNLGVVNISFVNSLGQRVTPRAGTSVFVHVDYETSDLPANLTYTITMTLNGVTYTVPSSFGSGVSGVSRRFMRWGTFPIVSGSQTVSVRIDSPITMSESNIVDNSRTLTFTA